MHSLSRCWPLCVRPLRTCSSQSLVPSSWMPNFRYGVTLLPFFFFVLFRLTLQSALNSLYDAMVPESWSKVGTNKSTALCSFISDLSDLMAFSHPWVLDERSRSEMQPIQYLALWRNPEGVPLLCFLQPPGSHSSVNFYFCLTSSWFLNSQCRASWRPWNRRWPDSVDGPWTPPYFMARLGFSDWIKPGPTICFIMSRLGQLILIKY